MKTYFFLAALIVSASLGCAPELENVGEAPLKVVKLAPAVQISTVPPAPLQQVPAVLQVLVQPRGDERLEPEAFFLVEGQLRKAQLGQLARDDISASLEARLLPIIRWLTAGGALVMAPTVVLEPGALYTLANGQLGLAQPLSVMTEDALPTLRRLWPPTSEMPRWPSAIWCGERALPPLADAATLEPQGFEVRILNGSTGTGPGARCAWLQSEGPGAKTGSAITPPLLRDTSGQEVARLEPVVFETFETIVPVAAATAPSCQNDERGFGRGCARIYDDRLILRTPSAPMLWMVSDGQAPTLLDQVFSSRDERVVLVHPLPAGRSVNVQVTTLDLTSVAQHSSHSLIMAAPMAHVIINEVLANAIGPEPQQEWVELYNDGSIGAQLQGYQLVDIGGISELPPGWLAPGGFALVVNESFDETLDYDALPAANTLILRVPKLGKGGLSNQGEPLKLFDREGRLVSRTPSTPKPKAGRSLARVHPKAVDKQPLSFVLAEHPSPGASNPRVP